MPSVIDDIVARQLAALRSQHMRDPAGQEALLRQLNQTNMERISQGRITDHPVVSELMSGMAEMTGVRPYRDLLNRIDKYSSPVTGPQPGEMRQAYLPVPFTNRHIDLGFKIPAAVDELLGGTGEALQAGLGVADMAAMAPLAVNKYISAGRSLGQRGSLRPSMVQEAAARGILSTESRKVSSNLDWLTNLDDQILDRLSKNPEGHGRSNAFEISGVLEKDKYLTGQIRKFEEQSGVRLLDDEGHLLQHPVEKRMRVDPKTNEIDQFKPQYGGFRRSLSQTYLDNMPQAERESFRQEIVKSVEHSYATGKGVGLNQSLPEIAAVDPNDYYRLPSAVKAAEKTVGAINLNSMCPMLNIGAHGCYLDGCYLMAMGKGGNGINFYRSAMYSGELLQLSDDAIAQMNKVGGIRINGLGDTSYSDINQWRDIFKHADMRGLNLKVISKQDDTWKIIDQLQKEGSATAKNIVLQPTVDPYWIPVNKDELAGSGASEMGLVKALERHPGNQMMTEAVANIYKDTFGRDVRVINGQLYRKYGYSWDQIAENMKKYPGVRVQPRVVVSTPKEIAEYALNQPEVLQTWMHAKVPGGMYSDIEGKVLNEEMGNFTKQISIAKDAKGEWHIYPQKEKASLETGHGTAYKRTEEYIKANYTPTQQERIFRTLSGQLDNNPSALCCKIGASKDACMDCKSACAVGTNYRGKKLERITIKGMAATK